MTDYERVLALAREQAAALARGELEPAIALLDERGTLLADAGPARPEDVATIREILSLDRALSSAIRERMIAIRGEALEGQHGRRAINGYGSVLARAPRRLNAIG